MRGYWDDAIVRGENATEAARRAKDESALARFSGNVGSIHFSCSEYEKARLTEERIIESYRNLKDEKNVAVSLHELGMIAQVQGDAGKAEQYYSESLLLKRRLGNETMGQGNSAASTLHQLGMLAEDQGDYETARQRYDESLEIDKKLGDQSGIASTLHQLGNIAYQQGDYETAQRRYAESLEIAKKLGDRSGIASSLGQIGLLAEKEGNNVEAARLFREALEIFERLKSPYARLARESLERVTSPSDKSDG